VDAAHTLSLFWCFRETVASIFRVTIFVSDGCLMTGRRKCVGYTGFSMRNLPYFGRTFLGLIYIVVTKNTFIWGWMLEKWSLLAVPHNVPV
jgi:hypothetical protein